MLGRFGLRVGSGYGTCAIILSGIVLVGDGRRGLIKPRFNQRATCVGMSVCCGVKKDKNVSIFTLRGRCSE